MSQRHRSVVFPAALFTTSKCGALNENGSHRPIWTNAWSLTCGTVLWSIMRCGLIGRVISVGLALRFQKPSLALFLMLVDKLPATALATHLPDAMPIGIIAVTFWSNPSTKSFLLLVALVVVFLHNFCFGYYYYYYQYQLFFYSKFWLCSY